jgi:hypothetical protein
MQEVITGSRKRYLKAKAKILAGWAFQDTKGINQRGSREPVRRIEQVKLTS